MTARRCPLPLLASCLSAQLALSGCRDSWNLVGSVDGDSPLAACEAAYRNELGLLALSPGDRSHWLMPWRGYSETRPAAALRQALGFGIFTTPNWLPLLPQLAQAGIARAALETHWAMMEPEGAQRFKTDEGARMRATLRALADNNLRPKLLLDSTVGLPSPFKSVELTTVQAAAQGERTLRLDARSALLVQPGRTRFDGPQGLASLTLITAIAADGTATLSRPLAVDVPAGEHSALVMAFAPFAFSPGVGNVAFENSMGGWLAYAEVTVATAREILGERGFDVEITRTPRPFFDARFYGDGPMPPKEEVHATMKQIVARTAAHLRSKGIVGANVVLADGTSNVDATVAVNTLSAGTTAYARRAGMRRELFTTQTPPSSGRPLDALGQAAGSATAEGAWQDDFIPAYEAAFPEWGLSALAAENLWLDLSPTITQDAQGTARGRLPQGPRLWVAGVSWDPMGITPSATSAERWRMQTKFALRSAVAYVGSGADAVFFHGPADSSIALIDSAVANGGPVLAALRRMRLVLGEGEATNGRALALSAVGSCSQAAQWKGDGSARFPDLLNRDVVAFFPFQAANNRFVAFAYVMTRSLGPAADGNIGLAPAPYSLRMSGLGANGKVSVLDLLTGETKAVAVKAVANGEVALTVDLDDVPRALVFTD